MGLKVVESQSEERVAGPTPAPAVPWFAAGLVLVGILALARVLLGVAWGARLASVGSPGPTLAGSLVSAVLLLGAGLVARAMGGGRLAQLCAGLSVLASPIFWVLFEDWRFPGGLTVGLGALELDGPLSTAIWMIGWVPLALAVFVWGLGLVWIGRAGARAFAWPAAVWLPTLLLGLAWSKGTGAALDEPLLLGIAAWTWGAAVLSGLGCEIVLARAGSRNPLHTLMLAFLVQLVLTAAWVLIGFR